MDQNIEYPSKEFEDLVIEEPENIVLSPENQIFYNKLEDLVSQTLDSIEFYSNRNDEEVEKLWDDPSKIFASIRDKTNKMKEIWVEYYAVRKEMDKIAIQKETRNRRQRDEEFKKLYLIKVTEAFEDELDNIRRGVHPTEKPKGKQRLKKESISLDPTSILVNTIDLHIPDDAQVMTSNEGIDYDILIDCLEDGADLWTPEEKELFIEESGRLSGKQETILKR